MGDFFLSFFDLLWLPGFGGTEGFVPLGSLIGDLSLPDDPCPPDLGGLGQKVEIFDGPPLPAPFGTKVPSCPLAMGPGAVLLVGRGLVGSSSELTSWIALFVVVIFNSISFSSLWAANVSCWTLDGISDAEFNFLDSFVCSEACAGKVISHNWEAELVDGLFCIDFWASIASSLFNRESMVWVNHSSSVLKVFGALMLLVHWWDFDTVAYEFLDGSVTGPSTCCLASWNGMFFWYFTLTISFSIFHLGQLLTYAGWSPLQLAHFASLSPSWSSCPACPHFA